MRYDQTLQNHRHAPHFDSFSEQLVRALMTATGIMPARNGQVETWSRCRLPLFTAVW